MPPSEWPRRVRLVVTDGEAASTTTKFADFPRKGVPGGPLAALRASVASKCYPGDATPVVIKFKDVGGGGWADADDDGDVELLTEMWAAEGRAAGRSIPLIPTLQVGGGKEKEGGHRGCAYR